MPELHRKAPVQPRALQTIETLLDAAAQVLRTEGEPRFTTNRVAEVAGFSIGTLYQYFPNKNAMVEALVERERAAVAAAIRKILAKSDTNDIEAILRSVVQTLIGAFSRRRRMRKFVVLELVRLNLAPVAQKGLDDIGLSVIGAIVARGGGRVRPLSEAAGFVFTRAILGAIRAAVLEDRATLDTADFEDEIVQLALRFVLA